MSQVPSFGVPTSAEFQPTESMSQLQSGRRKDDQVRRLWRCPMQPWRVRPRYAWQSMQAMPQGQARLRLGLFGCPDGIAIDAPLIDRMPSRQRLDVAPRRASGRWCMSRRSRQGQGDGTAQPWQPCPSVAQFRRRRGHSPLRMNAALVHNMSTEISTDIAPHSRLVFENAGQDRTRPLWRA